MPSIQGGGGFIPPSIQAQQAQPAAAKAQAPQPQAPQTQDVARFQAGPSQTTLGSQIAQRLTSESARLQIHQLIQQNQAQAPEQKPQLQMLQRPAMGSALASALAAHHVPEQSQNAHAQQAAGTMQASYQAKTSDHTEDSVRRSTLQSGKRVRKEEQEGEFSSLEDMFGGDGTSGGGTGQDQRSDSQKKKPLLTAEEKRKAPVGVKKPGVKPAPPGLKPGLNKPGTAAPSVTRVQMAKANPPPKPKATDEWTF